VKYFLFQAKLNVSDKIDPFSEQRWTGEEVLVNQILAFSWPQL
jgi:hypothetical protein